MNDAVMLKLAKLLDQHAFADVGQAAAQFAKAQDRAFRQKIDDKEFPFAAYKVKSEFKTATVRLVPQCYGLAGFRHGNSGLVKTTLTIFFVSTCLFCQYLQNCMKRIVSGQNLICKE